MGNTKRIAVDMTMLKYPYTGLGQFSLYLGRELLKDKAQDYEYDFLLYPSKTNFFPDLAYQPRKMHLLKRELGKNKLPFTSKRYDLWHIPSQNSRYFPFYTKSPIIYTIHDLNFLHEESTEKIEKKIHHIQKQINQASQITAISQYVATDIAKNIDLKGKKIKIIHNGVAIQHCPKATRPSFITTETPFIFTMGSITPRKNFHVLVEMMRFLPNLHLVVAGKKDDMEYVRKMEQLIETHQLQNRVIFTDTIREEAKYWLYKNCYAFAFPSLLEGFGMPVIEALSMKKPVFASMLTSLPEVGGKVVKYWTDFQPENMANTFLQGMHAIEQDTQFAENALAQAELFTWARAGKQYKDLYESILCNK